VEDLRIRAITPISVGDEELARRRERYRRLSPVGVAVELENLSDGPPRLETAEDIATSEHLVLAKARRTDPENFDLVLPDCVLDPAVDSGEPTPVPVVGLLKLSSFFLATLGQRFSAVARNEAIGQEIVNRVKRYKLEAAFAGVEILDLDFEAISDEARWHESLQPLRERFAKRRVGIVINGCSAVDVAAEEGLATVVVDPARLAVDLLGVAAASGLEGRW
jgi:Asp/Glu/hydantoin racemase